MKRQTITPAKRDAILADVRDLVTKHEVSPYTIIGFLKLAGKPGWMGGGNKASPITKIGPANAPPQFHPQAISRVDPTLRQGE